VTFSERKRNAFKSYFENMPIRQVSTTDDLRTWRQFRIGKLADLNMLDTRQCESDAGLSPQRGNECCSVHGCEARECPRRVERLARSPNAPQSRLLCVTLTLSPFA